MVSGVCTAGVKVKCQVTMCDPIWQVMLHGSEIVFLSELQINDYKLSYINIDASVNCFMPWCQCFSASHSICTLLTLIPILHRLLKNTKYSAVMPEEQNSVPRFSTARTHS